MCGRTEPSPRDARRWPGARRCRAAAFARADVRDPAQAQRLDQRGRRRSSAGSTWWSATRAGPRTRTAATASPRFHAKIIELNLIAPLHVAQSANAVMQGQPEGGSIIMIGSVSGTRPSPGTAAYGAAKAGLHHLAASLAVEWAPKVRVNTVVAGLGRHRVGRCRPLRRTRRDGARSPAPCRSAGWPSPDDVADACLFLASPLAAYVSGAALAAARRRRAARLPGGAPSTAAARGAGPVYAPSD